MNRPSLAQTIHAAMVLAAAESVNAQQRENVLEIRAGREPSLPDFVVVEGRPCDFRPSQRRDCRHAWKNRVRRIKRECSRRGKRYRSGR